MTTQFKSLVLLAATLVVGFTLGLFADATLVRGRRAQVGALRRPPGFVAHMEDVIQPHSDAQRDSIRPLLEQAAQRNGIIMHDANDHLRAALDSMRVALAPILDQSQRDRLAREVGRIPPFGPGGRRGGPPSFGRGGPPPDGRRGGPPPD
jgi:uncharacterized membrane protein